MKSYIMFCLVVLMIIFNHTPAKSQSIDTLITEGIIYPIEGVDTVEFIPVFIRVDWKFKNFWIGTDNYLIRKVKTVTECGLKVKEVLTDEMKVFLFIYDDKGLYQVEYPKRSWILSTNITDVWAERKNEE